MLRVLHFSSTVQVSTSPANDLPTHLFSREGTYRRCVLVVLFASVGYYIRCSQNSLQSPLNPTSLSLQQRTHVGNCFTGLRTECTGYNSNLVIAAQNSGTSGVSANSFDRTVYCNGCCIRTSYVCTLFIKMYSHT